METTFSLEEVKRAYQNLELTTEDFGLYSFLYFFSDKSGEYIGNARTIAQLQSRDFKTVQYRLRKLRDKGFLRYERKSKQRVIYTLNKGEGEKDKGESYSRAREVGTKDLQQESGPQSPSHSIAEISAYKGLLPDSPKPEASFPEKEQDKPLPASTITEDAPERFSQSCASREESQISWPKVATSKILAETRLSPSFPQGLQSEESEPIPKEMFSQDKHLIQNSSLPPLCEERVLNDEELDPPTQKQRKLFRKLKTRLGKTQESPQSRKEMLLLLKGWKQEEKDGKAPHKKVPERAQKISVLEEASKSKIPQAPPAQNLFANQGSFFSNSPLPSPPSISPSLGLPQGRSVDSHLFTPSPETPQASLENPQNQAPPNGSSAQSALDEFSRMSFRRKGETFQSFENVLREEGLAEEEIRKQIKTFKNLDLENTRRLIELGEVSPPPEHNPFECGVFDYLLGAVAENEEEEEQIESYLEHGRYILGLKGLSEQEVQAELLRNMKRLLERKFCT